MKWLGVFWTLLVLIVLLASFFPVLGQRQAEEEGEYCNQNLELIFEAKVRLSEELNVLSEDSPEKVKKEREMKTNE